MLQSRSLLLVASLCIALCSAPIQAQYEFDAGPWFMQTSAPEINIKVSVLARGIRNAWGMAFLPSGNILIAERAGKFLLLKPNDTTLHPVSGAPVLNPSPSDGLMDIALHPDFARNRLVYFTYVKGGPPPAGGNYYATTALGRGKLNTDETAMTDIEEIFVADAWSVVSGGHGSRLLFAPDGTLFMSSPFRRDLNREQSGMSHLGKVLRLNPDGSVPADNPFVSSIDTLPEIWSLGHRAMEGMAFHPLTGELWATEHGPQGGDEVNIIRPGQNYGWPLTSYGRDYDGSRMPGPPGSPDMTEPHLIWIPSIAPSGTMFYTGAEFPEWQNNLFVGSLMTARVAGTGHIQRIELNEFGEQKRESLLTEFKQRVRDVRQGPDGRIYILTEARDGALLVLERAE